MAFDIYAGPLTRFYLDEWENVAQAMAKAQGYKYTKISPGKHQKPSPEAVEQAVASFQQWLKQEMAQHVPGGITWQDSRTGEYFTDRPTWQGYTGLLLLAAYAQQPGMVLPEKTPETWDSDPAFAASVAVQEKCRFPHIMCVDMWLPADFTFWFMALSLTGQKTRYGSTHALYRQLQELNAATLKGTEDDLKNWAQGDCDLNDLKSAARFGLSLFTFIARNAVEHHTPILCSF